MPRVGTNRHAAFGTGPLELYGRYHDGTLAEYVRVPHWLLDILPDNVNFDVAAKVHDLGNALRALKLASLPLRGTLVVTATTGTTGTTGKTGKTGTTGTVTVRLAPFFGVGRLILVGRAAERLGATAALAGNTDTDTDTDTIEDLGADWADTRALTRRLRALAPAGADAVTDYLPAGVGSTQALAALTTGGTLVHMGANPAPFQLPAIALMQNMWRIVGSRACTRTDIDEVLRLLATGALHADDLVTHQLPLADINGALSALQGGQEPMWMGAVHPGAQTSCSTGRSPSTCKRTGAGSTSLGSAAGWDRN